MRAVLMSIKPEWWEKILAGEKDLEIRKTAPAGGAEVPWPLRVLVYVSGTGAVLGQFTCPGWTRTNFMPHLSRRACVPTEDLERYAAGKQLYGWMVEEPEAFQKPCGLEEYGLRRPPVSWQYIEIPDEKQSEVRRGEFYHPVGQAF